MAMTENDFETLSKSFIFVFSFCLDAAQTLWNAATTAILTHPWTQLMALRGLWMYSRTAVQVEKWYAVYLLPWFPGKTVQEPPLWTAVCTLDGGDSQDFSFSEVLTPHPMMYDDPWNNPLAFDIVVLTKTDADSPLICVRSKKGHSGSRVLQHSSAHFLAITYHHPDMGKDSCIPLEVPVEMMVVDNEILSPAFVRRALLSFRGLPFDDRYWIECIDQRIQFTKLTANQYLLLSEDGYHVQERLQFQSMPELEQELEPVLTPEQELEPEPVLAPEQEQEPVLAPEQELAPEPVLAPEQEPVLAPEPEPVLAPEPEQER